MKVLVIGGGGKEHALIWKLSRSKHITKIYCSPGNAGISGIAECIDVSPHNVDALVDFVKYEWIDLTIVCSETSLAQGIADTFERHGCRVFGINRGTLSLGASRELVKNFMKRHQIPTAEYQVFSSYPLAKDYVQLKGVPLVIKSNRYPGDNGVFVATTIEDALNTLKSIMHAKIYGESGSRVIIEEHLHGRRVSLVTIADDKAIRPLATVCKFREMPGYTTQSDRTVFGSYSPVSLVTKDTEQYIMESVMHPVHKALSSEGIPFKGFLSADLVIQKNNVNLFELQFGFGDLEPQTIMPVLGADIGELILSAAEERLSDVQIRPEEMISVCLALFSRRNIREEAIGSPIRGIDAIRNMEGVLLFHENTLFDNHHIVAPAGAALYLTAAGRDLNEAKMRADNAAGKINFAGMEYRKDIGNYIVTGGESL